MTHLPRCVDDQHKDCHARRPGRALPPEAMRYANMTPEEFKALSDEEKSCARACMISQLSDVSFEAMCYLVACYEEQAEGVTAPPGQLTPVEAALIAWYRQLPDADKPEARAAINLAFGGGH